MPFPTHATLRKPRRPHSLPATETTPFRPGSPSAGSPSPAPHEGRFKRLLGRKAHEELEFGCVGDEKAEQGGWAAYTMTDKESRHTSSSSTSSSAVPSLVHSRAASSNSFYSASSHSRTPSSSSTFSFNHSRGPSGSSAHSTSTSASSLPSSPTFTSDDFSAAAFGSSPKKAQRRSEEISPLDNAHLWGVRLSRVEEDTASRSAESSPRQFTPRQTSPRLTFPSHASPPQPSTRQPSTYGHSRRRDLTPIEFDFEITYSTSGSSTFTPTSLPPISPQFSHSSSTLYPSEDLSPSDDLETDLEELSEYFSHPDEPRSEQVFPVWPHRETVDWVSLEKESRSGSGSLGEQRRVGVGSGRNALKERRVDYGWI